MIYYLSKRFLRYFFLVYLVIACLGLFIEIIRSRSFVLDLNLTQLEWVLSSLLTIPRFTFEVLPIIFLLGAVLTGMNMIQKNEFLAFESLGYRPNRITQTLGIFSLMFGLLGFTIIFNPLMFLANKQYDKFFQTNESASETVFHIQNQIWIRFKIDDQSAFFKAERYNAEEEAFEDISIFLETPLPRSSDDSALTNMALLNDSNTQDITNQVNFPAVEVCYADKIRISESNWLAEGIFYCELNSEIRDQGSAPGEVRWMQAINVNISVEDIENLTKPEETSIFRSLAIQNKLDNLGLSFRDHNIHFNTLLSLPLLTALMTAIGVCFLPYFKRNNLYLGAFLVVIFGLGVFTVNNFIRSLGISQDLQPWLMSLLFPVPIAIVLLSLFGIKILANMQFPSIKRHQLVNGILILLSMYGINYLVCSNVNWEIGDNFWVIWVFPLSTLGVMLLLPILGKSGVVLDHFAKP